MNGTISITRAGQELGAWSAADIQKMLQAGVLTPDDHFWREGMTEWTTLARFAPPQPTTKRFPVRFGQAWSTDKLGFVGKGELRLMADSIELVGRRHWPGLARFGVFILAVPLGWFVCGSITGRLHAGGLAADFLLFYASLFTLVGVPPLVLTLMHYGCASWVKMRWPRADVSNVQCSRRVVTFDVPLAGSAKPRKAVVQAADAAAAKEILPDLLRRTTSVSSTAPEIVPPVGLAVSNSWDPVRHDADGTRPTDPARNSSELVLQEAVRIVDCCPPCTSRLETSSPSDGTSEWVSSAPDDANAQFVQAAGSRDQPGLPQPAWPKIWLLSATAVGLVMFAVSGWWVIGRLTRQPSLTPMPLDRGVFLPPSMSEPEVAGATPGPGLSLSATVPESALLDQDSAPSYPPAAAATPSAAVTPQPALGQAVFEETGKVPEPPPLSVGEARQEAVRRHPDLAVQGSPLNVEFVRLYVQQQEQRAEFFRYPFWPIRVADAAAESARGPHAPISLVTDLNAQTASHWGAEDISGRIVGRTASGGVLLDHDGKTIFVHGLPNERELMPGSVIPIAWGLSVGSRKEAGISYRSYRVMTETPATYAPRPVSAGSITSH